MARRALRRPIRTFSTIDTRHALNEYGVLRSEEVVEVAGVLTTNNSDSNHARIHAVLALP